MNNICSICRGEHADNALSGQTRACDDCLDLEYLTIREVAKILDCNRSTINIHLKKSKFPAPDATQGRAKFWMKDTIAKFTKKEINYNQIKSNRNPLKNPNAGSGEVFEKVKIKRFDIANSLFNKAVKR